MPEIIFITRKWPPAVGGMETYSVMLARELAKLGDVHVRALPGRSDGRPPGLLRQFGFLLASIPFLLRRRADVIHIGDMVLWPLAWLALVIGGAPRVAITVYGLDMVFGRRPGLLSRIYRRYLALGVRRTGHRVVILAISQFTARLCRDAGFRDVEVVTLGVEDSDVDLPVCTGDYVLFVGRLVPRKGAAWFVREVLPRLPSSMRLVVVGKGWDADEAASLRGDRRVDYREYESRESLRELRRAAIAVVMPNRPSDGLDVEGFGLTALEAAADGGVLLASDVDGISDAVLDGRTGFLLPAGNATRWAKTIAMVHAWPLEERIAFVERSQFWIKTRYSWQVVARRTLDAYRIHR